MSRTRRKPPTASKVRRIFRNPKGSRQALQQEARYGAIPPNELDDILLAPENELPFKALRRLHGRGVARDEAIHRVVNKFKITHNVAIELARRVYEDE